MKISLCIIIGFLYGIFITYEIDKQVTTIHHTYLDAKQKTMTHLPRIIVFLCVFIAIVTMYTVTDTIDQLLLYHICMVGLIIAFVDECTYYILDRTLLILLCFVVVYTLYHHELTVVRLFHCTFQLLVFYILLACIPNGLGGGDVKLCLIESLLFGFQRYEEMMILAILFGFLSFFCRWLVNKQDFHTYLSFGPSLILAMIVIIFYSS